MKEREISKGNSERTEVSSKTTDVVAPIFPTADNKGAVVLRARNERVEIGEIRPVEEGKPLHGELVVLERRAENSPLYDVRDSFDPRNSAPKKSGRPAQVATNEYRSNWDAIYGKSGLN